MKIRIIAASMEFLPAKQEIVIVIINDGALSSFYLGLVLQAVIWIVDAFRLRGHPSVLATQSTKKKKFSGHLLSLFWMIIDLRLRASTMLVPMSTSVLFQPLEPRDDHIG